MKTAICLLATALLAGCSKPAPDPRIAELEIRITRLEKANDEWTYQIAYLTARQTNEVERVSKLHSDIIDLRGLEQLHRAEIDSLHMMVTNLYFGPAK